MRKSVAEKPTDFKFINIELVLVFLEFLCIELHRIPRSYFRVSILLHLSLGRFIKTQVLLHINFDPNVPSLSHYIQGIIGFINNTFVLSSLSSPSRKLQSTFFCSCHLQVISWQKIFLYLWVKKVSRRFSS